jgi:CheY-like chemotaxis protein
MLDKPYIIIADDDLDDQALIQEVVTIIAPSVEIKFYGDGEELIEAYDLISEHRPMLIILDLIMPKKGGLETLKELNVKKNFADIPVIIFSTTKDETIELQSLKLGAKGYVKKPGSFLEMEKTMEYIFTHFTSHVGI